MYLVGVKGSILDLGYWRCAVVLLSAVHVHTALYSIGIQHICAMAGLRMNNRGSVAALAPWGLL